MRDASTWGGATAAVAHVREAQEGWDVACRQVVGMEGDQGGHKGFGGAHVCGSYVEANIVQEEEDVGVGESLEAMEQDKSYEESDLLLPSDNCVVATLGNAG